MCKRQLYNSLNGTRTHSNSVSSIFRSAPIYVLWNNKKKNRMHDCEDGVDRKIVVLVATQRATERQRESELRCNCFFFSAGSIVKSDTHTKSIGTCVQFWRVSFYRAIFTLQFIKIFYIYTIWNRMWAKTKEYVRLRYIMASSQGPWLNMEMSYFVLVLDKRQQQLLLLLLSLHTCVCYSDAHTRSHFVNTKTFIQKKYVFVKGLFLLMSDFQFNSICFQF